MDTEYSGGGILSFLWSIRDKRKGNSMRGFLTLIKICKEKRKPKVFSNVKKVTI